MKSKTINPPFLQPFNQGGVVLKNPLAPLPLNDDVIAIKVLELIMVSFRENN
jgi:hypothetical protein